jgi:hypothetical protein
MGQFVVAFSFIVVILQTTTILLERPESVWSFFMVQAVPGGFNTTITSVITTGNANYTNNSRSALNGTGLTEDQKRCFLANGDTMKGCLWHTHAPRRIETVLKEWNPHAILLTLCCIQLLICVSKTQYNHESKHKQQDMVTIHFPINYGIAIITILLLVSLVITGLKHPDLVQYPTIITIVVLLALTGWYARGFDEFVDDIPWNLAFHMLVISVPLAVLSLTTMGVRMWVDVLTHAVLLSGGGVCMWLQNGTVFVHPWSMQIVRFITIMLPTLSLTLAHIQRGAADNWLYAISLMGCAGLLPLYVFTIILPDIDERRNEKLKIRMAYLCTAGALLSLVVNLAMFNQKDA